jgi:negative regulator of flagellin synthesis FlgM
MDKITNNIVSNITNNITKNDTKTSKASISEASDNSVDVRVEASAKLVNINDSKKIVSDLASSAPIDTDKVAKIKAAISSGNYPLDLDKISDALMQAYREMKS